MHKTLFFIFALGLFFNKSFAQGNTDFEVSKNLDIYSSVFQQLYLHYADEIQVGDLNKKAIDAMLIALDPYTNYYPESDIEDVRFIQTGKYGGVGAAIHVQRDTIVVTEILEGSPFHLAGIKPGDRLIAADGQSLIGKTPNNMDDILKGNAGSKLSLTIRSGSTGLVVDKQIVRAEIKIPNVPYFGMTAGDMAYIKLTQFNETAAKEVASALMDLSTRNKVNGLILDLRDNGGGLLHQAVEIMDLFLPAGLLIVETKGKVKAENQRYFTQKPALYADLPVVVLINGRSASASEIVAGAFQDYDRGVVLGQKSFGKGLVQKVYPLSYNAQMKITVAKYYIPSGRCIQEINYSGRVDGKALKIADSLRAEFKTRNGRPVLDAGGILPDVIAEKNNLSAITSQIASEFLIFNFATQFVHQAKLDSLPQNFHLTDADFQNFKAFLIAHQFEYESAATKKIGSLTKDSLLNNNDTLQQLISNLYKTMKAHDQSLLDAQKQEIMQVLEQEIISRYLFDKGRIERTVGADALVLKAKSIVDDKNYYFKTLNISN